MTSSPSPDRWPPESLAFLFSVIAALILVQVVPGGEKHWPIALLALAVIVLGLPHGALDPWIAQQQGRYRNAWSFGSLYLGLSLAVVLIWWAMPVVSLSLFLAFSAWHFAQDWQEQLRAPTRLALGSALLILPVAARPDEGAYIFSLIAGGDAIWLAETLTRLAWLAIPAMVLIGIRLAAAARWSSAAEIVGLIAAALALPVLVYFTLYFCLLHSPRHFRRSLETVEGQQRKEAWRTAIGYSVLTLVFALPFAALLLQVNDWDQALLQLVFIGLAALTVPHMLLLSSPHVPSTDRT